MRMACQARRITQDSGKALFFESGGYGALSVAGQETP